ncbi:hypothetical protein [Bacillus pumilus]|uniref:hypothetical protein n=1 Tax=Bacillus pumilus TaxID=1408 RepID=UPI003D7136D4
MTKRDHLNPILNKLNKDESKTIQRSGVQQKKQQRVDKKHDIKIPLDKELIKEMKKRAFDKRMTLTEFTSYLLQKGVKGSLAKYHPMPERSYKGNENTVRAKLNKHEYEQLFVLQLEFDYRSQRQAAHHVLINMLMRDKEYDLL